MKINFIPIDYNYFDFQGKNYARIVGRAENGKRVCLIDTCDVYFWVILKDGLKDRKIEGICKKIERIKISGKTRDSRVLKTEVYEKNFLGKKVKAVKVFITNYKDAHAIASEILFKEVEKRREYDLGFITKYIIDRKLKPLNWYSIEGELLANEDIGGIANLDVDFCLRVENINEIGESGKKNFFPKVLAYDIETDEFEIGKGEIVLISLVGKDFERVLSWKKDSKKSYVEKCKDEADMLEKFVGYVKEYDPDVLTGYFSDGFDLPYLRARAEYNGMKLNLGLDNSPPTFTRGNTRTGKINGIIHVDLFRFIRNVYSQYLQSETLSLNEVASELLGEKKIEWEHSHSSKLDKNRWEDYFEYNLHDSLLAYKLYEKIWPDMLEFTKIVQEPLFDISRSTMASQVEDYLIHNLERFNEIAERRPGYEEIGRRRAEGRYEGAYVFQPIPGLYKNLAFFDFTSMYGSVIVSFNLSRSTLLEKKEKNSTEVDIGKKVYFSKEKGFFAEMLEEIIEKRKQYKKEYAKNPDSLLKARSNAFKLLTNAAYGYQGFFGARYYCIEAAAGTAALAKKEIKKTIEYIGKKGYKVVYGDTDSISFLRGKKSKKQVLDLLKKINSKLPGIMELDLEGFFKRGIWVTKRTGDFGAKKKYALIGEDNKIKIRGFETVRRDWCKLARKTQNEILKMILENGDDRKAKKYLEKIIKKIKNRDVDLKDLVIRTQLKKPIEEYKSINPHVTIAKRMKDEGLPVSVGMLIEYYIAESDKKRSLVRERARMVGDKDDYDIDYYLNKQILPSVENIFEVFNVDTKELVEGKKQTKLGEF